MAWGKHQGAAPPGTPGTPGGPGACQAQVLSTGKVYVWKPADGASIVQVACGQKHTAALDSKGRVWTFGSNRRNQLGARGDGSEGVPAVVKPWNDGVVKAKKVSCGWSHTVVLDEERRIHAFGRNDLGQCSELQGFWDDVEAGSEMILARQGEQVSAVGWNEHGNLGVGDTENRIQEAELPLILSPPFLIAAGGGHCAATAKLNLEHENPTPPVPTFNADLRT
mmetsp:Transcript_3241/g.5217  ORF Transcript_3241/g.5217 Transcript_3241/m.5217 type:complete len:223 (+) Transcript_3241:160-828(+)